MSTSTWLIIAAILIIVEIISIGLTSVWFAFGAFAAAVVSCFTDSLVIELAVFIAVSIVLWVFTRPIAMKYIKPGKEKTNVETLPGSVAIVTEKIDNLGGTGAAKINGLEWTARSSDNSIIEAGETVVINEVSGVKLLVTKKA